MSENVKVGLVQRITRNLLDIQILRLVQTQPMWGYLLKKQIETKFHVKLRHATLYTTLTSLERSELVSCEEKKQSGRTRKVYTITEKGEEYIEAYKDVLKEQIQKRDISQER